MTSVELPDGRRLSASYDWSRDWWVARLEGPQGRVAEGRLLHDPLRDLLGILGGVVSPAWLVDVVDRLAKRDTSLGRRAVCRCCGYLTLTSYGHYAICPVCNWEDDPTTTFEPGERAGPGPNHVSLTEGRHNFAQEGICDPWGKRRATVRDPLPADGLDSGAGP